MIEVIIKEFEKITYNACERYAKATGFETKQIQLSLGLDSAAEPTYKLCKNYNPEKKITFLEVLGVKIDFRGYSMIVPPFIQNKLVELAQQNGVPPEGISVMVIPKEDKKTMMWLYVNSTPKEQIKIEDLFA